MAEAVATFAAAPQFLYGTAWKEEETARLVELAIREGFRGIDTANQRRHYHEAAVGEAIARCIEAKVVRREELFLQTKYTFRGGQDHRLPYDPSAPIERQVEQSFASSLAHLKTDRIESLLLHGPSQRTGLGESDWAAWSAMERLHDSGRVRWLGVSNVSLAQLQLLLDRARVPPRFVQNRCYADRAWDGAVRRLCAASGMVYQGFSLLTANRQLLGRPEFAQAASRYGITVEQLVFCFAIQAGMLPLTGTTNAQHMREDLSALAYSLSPEDLAWIETAATPGLS